MFKIDFHPEKWTVRTESGRTYTALGYERRGIWNVPIADFLGEIPIQCGVYEILHGLIPTVKNYYVSIENPNHIELILLEEAGWLYIGGYASYKGVPA